MVNLVAIAIVVLAGLLLAAVLPWPAWALTAALVFWGCWVWWQRFEAYLNRRAHAALDLREHKAEVEKREQEVAMLAVQVTTAQVRVPLIPDGYIGTMAAERPLVWTFEQKVTAPALQLQQNMIDALPPALPRAEPFCRIMHEVRSGHLILGYNLAGQVLGDLPDLLSTAIIGRPGTGKTTALRFISAQVLQIGGRALLMDPHGSIADELADLLESAEDGSEIERLADPLEQELDTRLALRREQAFAPLLLIADEWPVISRLSERAVAVAGRIVLEGRKVNMYALICGHGLPSEQLGGSLIRDALSSRYVFNTTPAQARMAGLDNETAKALMTQLDTAGPGYAILASARRRPEVIAVPDTAVADLRLVLGERPQLPPLPMRPVSLSPAVPHTAPFLPVSEREKERKTILTLAAEGYKPYVIARMMGKAGAFAEEVKRILAEEAS